ncbi:MAG: hypothetical protein KDD47_12770 [Acidobacteria bacterium]|nr:hypothetical protein [Acidobacteriota bacterium]
MENLTQLDKVLSGLERALESSPADFTEISWIERAVYRATSSGRSSSPPRYERTVLVRVRELGRFGFHRLDDGEPETLADAIRQALAQARVHAVTPIKRPPEPGRLPAVPRDQLFDRELARLQPEEASDLLASGLDRGEKTQLEWTEGRVAVVNSLGARRRARVTAATLFAAAGRGPEAGVARGSSRRLDRLFPQGILDLARRRCAHGAEEVASPKDLEGPLILSPEATASLLAEVGSRTSADFGTESALTFLDQCFGRSAPILSVYDDGSDASGMPFPFDLSGSAKRRLDLVEGGSIRPLPVGSVSPSDQTGCFAAGGDETQLANLFLAPGTADLEEILEAADGGVWISAFRRLACHDPVRLLFRAESRGLRRIRQGRLAEALPDRIVEGNLADLLRRARLAGRETVAQSVGDGIFGAVTAPALVLAPASEGTR